jgi:ATP-dependent exoDNAse (exonuclease V) alpha subunit
VNHEQLNHIFLQNFPYEANAQQAAFFGDLAKFVFSTSHQCFLLTGYAGTGKTTVVKSVVETYKQLNGHIILLAPTGRASKVLSQRTGKSASTIHRHIYMPKSNGGLASFTIRPNKYKHALFVVDEASMIADSPSESQVFGGRSLLNDLIEYIAQGHKCKVLLIGDDAQLPPVGVDLSPALNPRTLHIDFGLTVATQNLSQVIRQAEKSTVLRNATQIRKIIADGNLQKPKIELAKDVVRLTDPYEMEEIFQSCFADHNNENGIMIVRSNKRANKYNLDIRARIQFKEDILSSGDQLMVVKNSYHWLESNSEAGFIANGDTIEVLSLRNREEMYGHTFTDATIQLLDYPNQQPIDVKIMLDVLEADGPALPHAQHKRLFDDIFLDCDEHLSKSARMQEVMNSPFYNALQVKFAHVVTCHKAQGGQWPNVIIEQSWLPDGEIDQEYLRWLYTAFTRAQENVYLIGFDDSFFA